MKKILVTENQLKILKKVLVKEAKLRTYVFDWDDNILRMPTKIKMDKLVNGDWQPVEVSTEDFAHVRSDSNYKIKPNSFEDFVNDEMFIVHVKEAIKNKSFAPSFKKFIEALIHANHFAINTARGHSPQAIKNGVKIFINKVLSNDQKSFMINTIKKNLPENLTQGLDGNQLIDLYLDEMGDYYPVSSKEFLKKFGLGSDNTSVNPEFAKQVAIEDFVKKILKGVNKHMIGGKYKKISVGFSDDDVKNVNSVKKFIDEQLKKMFPQVHFVVYDTSMGGKKKMVIEKD